MWPDSSPSIHPIHPPRNTDKQYLRLITAPYFHVNALHIIMNMLSFVGIGAYLEMQQGTLYLFMTIAYATVITNVVYIGICEILLQATKNMHWYYYSSIGFSGVSNRTVLCFQTPHPRTPSLSTASPLHPKSNHTHRSSSSSPSWRPTRPRRGRRAIYSGFATYLPSCTRGHF